MVKIEVGKCYLARDGRKCFVYSKPKCLVDTFVIFVIPMGLFLIKMLILMIKKHWKYYLVLIWLRNANNGKI